MKNIILVGLEGTNKFEIGKDLASKLQMKFIDSNEVIERKSGLSILELIKTKGIEHFHSLEDNIIREISSSSNTVIVTGGGSLLRRKNVKILKRNGTLISLITSKINLKIDKSRETKSYLHNQWNTLFDSAKSILNLKTPGFPAADYLIDISDLSVEEVIEKIIEKIGRDNFV